MVLGEDAPIPAARYCYPRIEAEIGYVLGSALPGAGCTEADVLAATEYIVPILPGSCTRAIDARPGAAFRAEFAGLGTVTASFE